MRRRTLRALSPTEKIWLATGNLSPPFVITLVIEGGDVAPQSLQDAVARAAAANPGARAILKCGLRGPCWLHGDRPPMVRSLARSPQPGRLEGGPLRDDAPAIEVGLAPGSAIVFCVHHALMDGRGLLHFAEEVFRALRGERVLGGQDDLTDMWIAGTRRAARRGSDRRRFVAATGRHVGSIQPVWGRRRVEGTWHDLLPRVALGILGFARRLDARAPVRFHIPVDLRRYGSVRSTSNLTGIISIDPEPGTGVADIASALNEKLAAGEALRWVAGVKVVERVPLWLLRLGGKKKVQEALRTSRFDATAIISNLGRVELEAFSAPGFEARRVYWLPPCGPATAAAFGIIGDTRGVELTAVLPAGLASEGRLDRWLDSVAQAMLADRESTGNHPRAAPAVRPGSS